MPYDGNVKREYDVVLTVQRLFPAYLRLGLQGVEHSGTDEQIGERTNDQR